MQPSEDFELRLFCATKHKVIGCIGEPLMVTVIHQVRPPPVATLQVRCDGRSAVLRWKALDLGAEASKLHWTNMEGAWCQMGFGLFRMQVSDPILEQRWPCFFFIHAG